MSKMRTLHFFTLKLRNRTVQYGNKTIILGSLSQTQFYMRHPSWPSKKNLTLSIVVLQTLIRNDFFRLTKEEESNIYKDFKEKELELELNLSLVTRQFTPSKAVKAFNIGLLLVFFLFILLLFIYLKSDKFN